MTEDFIIEEESGEDSPSRRPFLIAVGILLTILILAIICSAATLSIRNNRGRSNGNAEQIAARETENAAILANNEAVTATIAAMETEQALPTETPTAPATNTPTPTNTPRPTNTPVVRPSGDDEVTETPEPSSADADGTADTPTPIAPLSGTNGGSDDDALPQTGIETWGALVAGLALVAILFAARRLRGG
ncbi:MAG: LPXTG cell wall anchor domain-containing protein [Chloroflexi bacterium]|nr:LPXTG cell wall anchor domain-containing protein [Chloroflexota bacterium]